ncbi:protein RALF-like 33 [Vitis riparia]|uniref:protein RALF-like 33 n=1 Tax=Vitis riparia TaxID=96939 RepID=UPI00155B2944|nr:protein RALF-like 33 [Vitis riparia]
MANSVGLLAICAAAFLIAASAVTAVDSTADNLSWIPTRSVCKGTVAECLALAGGEDEFGLTSEFAMDSEINRRILATSKYISYGALQRNSVPCSRRGASYYNCQAGAQANPYNRGCSTITRCRS